MREGSAPDVSARTETLVLPSFRPFRGRRTLHASQAL